MKRIHRLIVTSATDHAYLEVERRLGMPVAFIDRPPTDIVADTIVFDNTAGAREAVEHLLRQKHRRIGLVGDLSRLTTHRERFAAFENAMTAAGIANWQKYVRSDSHDVATAERAVRELLDLVPAPTALFTTNNRITIGALRALRDRPDPPALVGFDDFDLADLLGVTVIAHDPERMGELAAELVVSRIHGEQGPAPEFGRRRDEGPEACRSETHVLDPGAPAGILGTRPPSERLLSPVGGEGQADHETQDE